MPQSDTELGIIIPAYGAEYVQMAAVAAMSAREVGNTCPIHLHTNIKAALESKVLSGIFDKIIVREEENNRCLFVKVEAYQRTPFQKTVVMDADQVFLAKIDQALSVILGKYEICAPLRSTPATTAYSLPGLESQKNFSHWNTGTFGFNKTAVTESFFNTWERIHVEENWKPDQPSFAKAIYCHPEIRFLSLDLSWGWLPKYRPLKNLIKNQIKIEHYVDINHRPAAAREVLKLNAQLRKHEDAPTHGALCLGPATERRYKIIGSKFFDNPVTPIVRRAYNAIKPIFGVRSKLNFLHKEQAWK